MLEKYMLLNLLNGGNLCTEEPFFSDQDFDQEIRGSDSKLKKAFQTLESLQRDPIRGPLVKIKDTQSIASTIRNTKFV